MDIHTYDFPLYQTELGGNQVEDKPDESNLRNAPALMTLAKAATAPQLVRQSLNAAAKFTEIAAVMDRPGRPLNLNAYPPPPPRLNGGPTYAGSCRVIAIGSGFIQPVDTDAAPAHGTRRPTDQLRSQVTK